MAGINFQFGQTGNTTPMKYGYAQFYAGMRKNPPQYSVSFGPFYAASTEIAAFMTELNNLKSASNDVLNAVQAISDYCNSNITETSITVPSFDINVIIPSFDVAFSFVDALTGQCGLQTSVPSTVMGAVQMVAKKAVEALIDNVLTMLNKIDYMFSAPTQMVNNLLRFLDDTNTAVKKPLADYRKALYDSLVELRIKMKRDNDPNIKIEYINKMNLVGSLDRKINELTTLFRNLEIAISKLLKHMENCCKIGIGLCQNINNIITQWPKDTVCIQAKFKTIIEVFA